MRLDRDELEALRADAASRERARDFTASRRAVERWTREHPTDLESALAWIETLRQIFGDPPVDRRPWRGNEFRL
jgi:hypothetical protein